MNEGSTRGAVGRRAWLSAAYPCGRVPELGVVESRERPAGGEEIGIRSLLDDPPRIDDQDPVGVANGGQSVGDDQRCATLQDIAKTPLDEYLGTRVD